MSAADARIRLLVSGIVQGVGFRYHVLRAARALGLTGYVMNRRDGAVEIVAEGPRATLAELAREVSEGPGRSVVRGVEVEWSEATGGFAEFDVRFH